MDKHFIDIGPEGHRYGYKSSKGSRYVEKSLWLDTTPDEFRLLFHGYNETTESVWCKVEEHEGCKIHFPHVTTSLIPVFWGSDGRLPAYSKDRRTARSVSYSVAGLFEDLRDQGPLDILAHSMGSYVLWCGLVKYRGTPFLRDVRFMAPDIASIHFTDNSRFQTIRNHACRSLGGSSVTVYYNPKDIALELSNAVRVFSALDDRMGRCPPPLEEARVVMTDLGVLNYVDCSGIAPLMDPSLGHSYFLSGPYGIPSLIWLHWATGYDESLASLSQRITMALT